MLYRRAYIKEREWMSPASIQLSHSVPIDQGHFNRSGGAIDCFVVMADRAYGMANELDPVVDQWYWHIDKGPGFYVTAINEDARIIEVQHYDGDIEEYTFAEWRNLDIELGEEPENWTGSLDIAEKDDLGTEITDTQKDDWEEPLSEYRSAIEGNGTDEAAGGGDDYGEGHMEERPLDGEDANITGPGPIDISNVSKRPDGVYEEVFNDVWSAEYVEDPGSGLWQVNVFKHDVPEWCEGDFESLQEAVAAARNYYDQT